MAAAPPVAPPLGNYVIPIPPQPNVEPHEHVHWLESASCIKKVVVGIFATIIEIPVVGLIITGVVTVLDYFKCDLSNPQDIERIWDNLDAPSKFARIAMKTALFGYIVILGPILEEFVFRIILHRILEEYCTLFNIDTNSTQNKTLRILLNGLIFGFMHLSDEQGWSNVIIFISTFLSGCLYDYLREVSDSILPSTAGHMFNNFLVTLIYAFGED